MRNVANLRTGVFLLREIRVEDVHSADAYHAGVVGNLVVAIGLANIPVGYAISLLGMDEPSCSPNGEREDESENALSQCLYMESVCRHDCLFICHHRRRGSADR